MSYFFYIVGCVLICYTALACVFNLPQLSDFLPVGSASEPFYKIVSSSEIDSGPFQVVGLGAIFVLIGVCLKHIFNR